MFSPQEKAEIEEWKLSKAASSIVVKMPRERVDDLIQALPVASPYRKLRARLNKALAETEKQEGAGRPHKFARPSITPEEIILIQKIEAVQHMKDVMHLLKDAMKIRVTQKPKPVDPSLGRRPIPVTREQVLAARARGVKWTQMQQVLGISRHTALRRAGK
jgi:hypothetical protein